MEEKIFIDPFSDTGFKSIFGREGVSEVLIKEFLNEIFRDQPFFEEITDVYFNNTERQKQTREGKTIIHDVTCVTKEGHHFILEMQKVNQDFFMLRSFFYVAKGVTDQGMREQGDEKFEYRFMPVTGVYISTFHVREMPEKLLTHVGLCDTDTGKMIDNHIRFAYIQMPYFNKKEEECETKFEKIIYTLKHMPTLHIIPFQQTQGDFFSQIDKAARYAALSREEKMAYDEEMREFWDRGAQLATAERKGRAEGRAEGRVEGIDIGKRSTAVNLKNMGFSAADIAKATGLPLSEIEKL